MALHAVKLACELPTSKGLGLSTWDCAEIARQLVSDGLVESISPESVRRLLSHHKLKPWRVHHWLSAQVPRDASFKQTVDEICDLYTRPLAADEVVLSFDEKTNLQPRPRAHETKPAVPGGVVQVEHEYARKGAIHLFAAFDTRTGKAFGICYPRKRALEFVHFLDAIDAQLAENIRQVHVVLENLPMHKSKLVRQWLEQHPRFVFHFTPVHCSWMNQVEQWFGVLQRKSLRVANFPSVQELGEHIYDFIDHHNRSARPYKWRTSSFDKIRRKCDRMAAAA